MVTQWHGGGWSWSTSIRYARCRRLEELASGGEDTSERRFRVGSWWSRECWLTMRFGPDRLDRLADMVPVRLALSQPEIAPEVVEKREVGRGSETRRKAPRQVYISMREACRMMDDSSLPKIALASVGVIAGPAPHLQLCPACPSRSHPGTITQACRLGPGWLVGWV